MTVAAIIWPRKQQPLSQLCPVWHRSPLPAIHAPAQLYGHTCDLRRNSPSSPSLLRVIIVTGRSSSSNNKTIMDGPNNNHAYVCIGVSEARVLLDTPLPPLPSIHIL